MHKLSERNVYTEKLVLASLARFLQKMNFLQDSRNTTLAKFLQEMRMCSKIVARILQDLLSNSPILQDMYFLQEFYKSFIDCKNFARFLQNCFSRELGLFQSFTAVARLKNLQKVKITFFWRFNFPHLHFLIIIFFTNNFIEDNKT